MQSAINRLTHITAVTLTNLRTLPQRLGAALAAAVGVAGVVAVMVAVLSIAEGFRATLSTTGSEASAIVLRGGSDTEMNSLLSLEETRIIANAPGVVKGPQGPLSSAELFVIVDIPKRDTGTDANVPLRGVQPAALLVRENIEIVEGRAFQPGRNEIIAGIGAAAEFAGIEVGSTLHRGEFDVTVVGLFSSGGTLWESELWCDVKILQPAYRRGSSFQSVYARLESPSAFQTFKDALTADPRLDVKVMRESDYFAEQSELIHGVITSLGYLVAGLMGIGAIFGAVNTMYSAVAARTREIATLRALGFGAAPVVISVLVESLLLSFIGGLFGGTAAYLAADGYRAATMNWSSFSQVTFAFSVTPLILGAGILWALAMGLICGILPAYRAMRLPVATALREL